MDIKLDSLRPVKSYIFDFTTGLIWTATILAAWRYAKLETRLAPVDFDWRLADSSASIQVLLVLAGVVTPFALSVALKPLSLATMNLFLSLEILVRKHLTQVNRLRLHNQTAGERLPDADLLILEQLAHDHIRQFAPGLTKAVKDAAKSGAGPVRIGQDVGLTFLRVHALSVAEWIERDRDDTWFRSGLVLPTAILVGFVLLLTTPEPTLSIGAAFCVYLVMASRAMRGWRSWHEKLNGAILTQSPLRDDKAHSE